jgi:phosphonate degradation associated HDIG domain protein
MTVDDEILGLFQHRGASAYFGEDVSMNEHALQAAYFARQDGAGEALVLAALLHDVGHLVAEVPDDIADWTTDAHHELVGSRWLAERFGPAVSEPVRLHVPAKRYLLATDPDYFALLSPASVVTLKLQGGPMSVQEVGAFERETYHQDAIRVRRCDDRGKVAGLKTPSALEYRGLIRALLL